MPLFRVLLGHAVAGIASKTPRMTVLIRFKALALILLSSFARRTENCALVVFRRSVTVSKNAVGTVTCPCIRDHFWITSHVTEDNPESWLFHALLLRSRLCS
jgi:hypothetical protein